MAQISLFIVLHPEEILHETSRVNSVRPNPSMYATSYSPDLQKEKRGCKGGGTWRNDVQD